VNAASPWLALDTATDLASVAVGVPPQAAGATTFAARQAHAAQLVELIDRTLRSTAHSWNDVAGIVVADGPGSFTGLRIGWAAAKGLAQERGLPLVAIPSLLAAAAGAAAVLGPVPVAACFDALRDQVFGAVYVVHATRVETIVAPDVWAPAGLIAATPRRPRVAVGDGAVRYAADMERWSGAVPISLADLRPGAASLLALCRQDGAGRNVSDATAAEPDYGRPAEAQRRWEASHGRPLPNPTRAGS
jgi:tRNA threonylcarbamoyladenosine biosynthesis protein TsaB